MSSKASSSATLFLSLNILFVLLVSNTITCEAPGQHATTDPSPATEPEPTSDPAPATDPEPTPNPAPANNPEPSSNPAPANDSPPNSTAPAPPAGTGDSCSIKPIRIASCIRFLYFPIIFSIKPCCEILSSFLQSDAKACVCPFINSIGRFGINIGSATSDILLSRCNINGTVNIQCA